MQRIDTPQAIEGRQTNAERDIEARKVLAYQQGFNDRMAGREKFAGVDPDIVHASDIVHGAYLQGWNDAGTLQQRK